MLVYLTGRQLHIGLDEHARIIGLGNLRKRDPNAVFIERLALTFEQPRLDGDTLFIDAAGLIELISMIAVTHKTGRAIHDRLCTYFPGEPHLNVMMRAVLRAVLPKARPATGDEAYYLKRALEQLSDYRIVGAHQSSSAHLPIELTRH